MIELNDAERGSPLLDKLIRYYADRLVTLRASNDNDLSPEDTARIRGKIIEVKAFLAIGQEKPTFISPGTPKPKR